MGLAAPKNRFKISADPNNTTWSKNTDRFGHKILTKQGWTPGEFLGAKDANHSGHYTAANASHIRVQIKDDTLGLGRKKGSAENDNFGLSLFQGVLGRLNGKSDAELKTESAARKRLESRLYGGSGTQFVFGGYLVGDKIEDLKKNVVADKTSKSQAGISPSEDGKPEKKRKRSGDDEEAPKLKKKNRKSDLKAEYSATSSPDDSEEESKKKAKSKKSKRSKSKDKALSSESENTSATERKDKNKESEDKKARKEAKKALKAEKRAKKKARRLEKEKRKQDKAKKDAESDSSSSSESEADVPAKDSTAAAKTGGVAFAGNRLAVRQRYIRQKKMASMDTQALKEIFMVKSQA
ncbi:uncharacterized protein J3D65DRAFT_636113 [Phyllosticta citribraziliensis]|uniref:PinX1-related protein 1 n=1 Tax=Phyllosticta citribraziliensis TaxID=989973 RepID=A0ABR1LED8_9PEZI